MGIYALAGVWRGSKWADKTGHSRLISDQTGGNPQSTGGSQAGILSIESHLRKGLMMNLGMFMLFPLLLLGGGMGGANELLDYMQSEAYWKAKNVTPTVETLTAMIVANPKAEDISALIKQLGDDDFEKREAATAAIAKKGPGVIAQLKVAAKSADAEVADRATRLISQLSGGDTDPAVHKLMIIRALGETKDKAALPALMALVDSKEPFVAEHAKRAIAKIEGKPFAATMTTAQTFEKDVWMLPKGVKLVTQLTMASSGPVNWEKALAQLNVGALGANISKDDMMAEMQKGVAVALNHVGNIRLDGITLGLAGDVGDNSGYVVIFVRGQYSREKVKNTFIKMGQEVEDLDGLPSVETGMGMQMLMPSDELFVLFGGPPNGAAPPVKEILAAIKTGKGTLSEDPTMTKLIASANRKSGGWVVIEMTNTFRGATPMFRPFDSVIAERVSEKGKTSIKVQGTGNDADEVKAAVNQMNSVLEEARANINQAGGFIPKNVVDFVKTVKIQVDGKNATLTGSMEGGFEEMLGGMLFPMMMLGGRGF